MKRKHAETIPVELQTRADTLFHSFSEADRQRLREGWLRLKAREEAGECLTQFQRACWRAALRER